MEKILGGANGIRLFPVISTKASEKRCNPNTQRTILQWDTDGFKHYCINDHPKWVASLVKVPPLTTPLRLIFPETSQGPIHDQK